MRQIDFYQIGQAGLVPVLVLLLKKTLSAKKRALILCPMPAASAIDDALWTHDADSWIAHGLDDYRPHYKRSIFLNFVKSG